MLKILSTSQVREADQYTIKHEPIASIDLMERAASRCVDWITNKYSKLLGFAIIAGPGNNGGDALVIARQLIASGYDVETYLLAISESLSEDCAINLKRLEDKGAVVNRISSATDFPELTNRIVIDGVFGSGLSRPLDGLAKEFVEFLNDSMLEVVAIDTPSGLFADKPLVNESVVVKASHTLSLELPKLAFMLPSSAGYVGDLHIIPIGINGQILEETKTTNYYLDSIEEFYGVFERKKFDHKGTFGTGLLISGSYGMMGAAVLASRAALRGGIGKLKVHVPTKGVDVLQSSVPEAMCSVDPHEHSSSICPPIDEFTVIAIGPGLGTSAKAESLLVELLHRNSEPMIIDADALNVLSNRPELLKSIPARSILTPHVGEFERLFGKSSDDFERLNLLRIKAQELKSFIILKGGHTAIATPSGNVFFNSTGNPGMATAGSGDVLTGILLALLAQTKDPKTAALCGVYIHGLAGDLGAELTGEHGLIASDIAESIPFAINSAFNLEE